VVPSPLSSTEPEGPAPAGRPRFDQSTRLRNRQQFDTVFQSGIKVVNRQLVVRIRPVPAGSPSRLGLSVSRKVGGAPRRNRVKRCLRAAFRELSPGLEEPLELVLIARPMSAPDTYAEALRSLRDILAKHHKRRPPSARDGRIAPPTRAQSPPQGPPPGPPHGARDGRSS
jgi:ribonuclease P protein component